MLENKDDRNFSGDAGKGTVFWTLKGARAALTLPGFLLFSAFVGFTALARESGLSLGETAFMSAVIWALPAQIILIGAITSKMSWLAAALAVSLSSVRLMPMVLSLTPEMKTRETRPWVPYVLSHFIAVTSWVIAMEHFPNVPRRFRTSFYAGIGVTLLLGVLLASALVYGLAQQLPEKFAAMLFFVTPMYFLISVWGSARERSTHTALILGLILGPIFHILTPKFDLLIAGIFSGVAAYGLHYFIARAPNRNT